ncbi:MAG: PD-(D/E)XK nuclease family protein, partial [Mogibacterium sp.]|nr:PD-(D/E)XK nuclease family protein [Mogibacterium sp.]
GWDVSMSKGQPGAFNTADDGMRHLINHIKGMGDSDPDALTRAMLRWYSDNRRDEIRTMLKAAEYDNDPAPIPRATAKELFGRSDGTLTLSASSISAYIDCPFKYFVDRGLKPEEERTFASDPRSVGDIYHECLMAVARQIMGDEELREKMRGTGGSGPDTEELERLVNEALDELSQNYRGGLFISAGGEEYRMSRIREICAAAAEAMASQLAAESVTDAVFEEGFGRQKRFEPIKLNIGDDEVYVEGKIDRADMIDTDGTGRVRIIDYKTGSDKLDLWKMRNGYKMQLMIYMISAATGGPEPAGMFYFNIKDPIESANDKTADQIGSLSEREAEDEFKLKGVYINEEGVLGAMPEKVLASSKNSISREEYEETRNDVLARIEETASGILGGKIRINPLRNDGRLVCSYCEYRSVCRRDRGYWKNSARIMPKKKK